MTFTPSTGVLEGVPRRGAVGIHPVVLKANNGVTTVTLSFSIRVISTNRAPVAKDDSGIVDEDTPLVLDVMANDEDPDQDALAVAIKRVPGHGTAIVLKDNQVRYTPEAEWSGNDTFTYTVTDPTGASDEADVFVSVHTINDAPRAVEILEPGDGSTFEIGGHPDDVLTVRREASFDPEREPVTYSWQLSGSSAFSNLLMDVSTANVLLVDIPVHELAAVLDPLLIDPGSSLEVFHRVVVSDGSQKTSGPNSRLIVKRGALTGTEHAELPREFVLHGNFPNPFNPSTSVVFDLPSAAEVTIEVFDVTGKQVNRSTPVSLPAGTRRSISIDGVNLASGTYLYRVTVRMRDDTKTRTGRMTLIK